jgi:competence protein ComEA
MKVKYLGILVAILFFIGMGIFYSAFQSPAETVEVALETNSPWPNEAGTKESGEVDETLLPDATEVPLAKTPIDESVTETSSAEENTVPEEVYCYVHVCGEVNQPGMYVLPSDSRVAEAIEAAGGFTKEAQEASVNLARKLQDGEQLYVLSKEEALASPAAAIAGQEENKENGSLKSGTDSEGKINLNLATKEELMTLPGIGSAKADAILSYRTEQGSFTKIEDIKKIEGIKDGVFQKIKDKITV